MRGVKNDKDDVESPLQIHDSLHEQIKELDRSTMRRLMAGDEGARRIILSHYVDLRDMLDHVIERLKAGEPVPESDDGRDPSCVKEWPECYSGGYDPKCCRFPKSCSC